MTIDQQYPKLYAQLKRWHSPAKAVEILLDAKRGSKKALTWIKIIRSW